MSGRTLEIVERLAAEVIGHGTAVSVDRFRDRCEVRIWDAKGAEVRKVEAPTKDRALVAMRQALVNSPTPAKPRLGRSEIAMLRRLARAADRGGDVGLGAGYDPGAEAPRRTLDAIVKKGLASAGDLASVDGGDPQRFWTITDAGLSALAALGENT